MSVRSQAASFGPEPRSHPFVILDVEHYASGYKRACGLAHNQKLPPVNGHGLGLTHRAASFGPEPRSRPFVILDV